MIVKQLSKEDLERYESAKQAAERRGMIPPSLKQFFKYEKQKTLSEDEKWD